MKNSRPRLALVRTCALGAIAMLSIVMACEARLPTSAEVANMDAGSAEKAAVQAKLVDEKSQRVVYKVDGVVVTAAEARSIAADHIASVSVTKSGAAEGEKGAVAYATVNVTTGGINTNRASAKVEFEKGAPIGTSLTERGSVTGSKAFNGLVYIDGLLAAAGILKKLGPNEIASVEILKGDAARKLSADPAAANGVIIVTTKHAKELQ